MKGGTPLHHSAVHQLQQVINASEERFYPQQQVQHLFIVSAKVCLNCHVWKQEITIEMILFKYSRRVIWIFKVAPT